jgi:hypothetical protein
MEMSHGTRKAAGAKAIGTGRNAADKENRRIRNRTRGMGNTADWGEADSALVRRVIVAVTKRGGAVQFGYTKDGAAHVIRIVGDGEPYNEYVRPTEDVNLYLEGLAQDFESPD